MFLDTTVCEGTRLRDQSALAVRTHFQRRPSNTHISPLVTRQACKTDSSKVRPYESLEQTPQRTLSRKTFRNLKDICRTEVIHTQLGRKTTSEIKYTRRCSLLTGKKKTQKDILPFLTQYRPSVSILKQALLTKWHLIQNSTHTSPNFQRIAYHFVQKKENP